VRQRWDGWLDEQRAKRTVEHPLPKHPFTSKEGELPQKGHLGMATCLVPSSLEQIGPPRVL
jgi:hypothetical protein